MPDQFAVSALVRKRAELAGRAAHAKAELDAILASLAAVDTTLRLLDPQIRLEAIRVKRYRPLGQAPTLTIRARDLMEALREAGRPMTAREIAARLLAARGLEREEAPLARAAETVGASLRRQRARGLVACEPGLGQCITWRLAINQRTLTDSNRMGSLVLLSNGPPLG